MYMFDETKQFFKRYLKYNVSGISKILLQIYSWISILEALRDAKKNGDVNPVRGIPTLASYIARSVDVHSCTAG